MFALALALPLAASALAMPNPRLPPRQDGSPCAGFGENSTDSPSYNFTLAAYNSTGSNANSTGAPLVLAWGPPGDSAAASAWVFSTYASWGSDEWPYNVLEQGALLPQPGPSEDGLGAYNLFAPTAGEEVIWFVTTEEEDPSTQQIFCAVNETSSEYDVLAVNGSAGNFSLCAATTDWVTGSQFNLVYAPASNGSSYVYETCYPVRVQLIPYV